MRVRDGHAKSCLACGKSKQKCMGAVWENGDVAGREPSGAANVDLEDVKDLLRELVEGQKMLAAEVRVLGENLEDKLGGIMEVILWGQDPIWDAKDYAEWVEEWDEEKMERDIVELREESRLYQDFLKKVLNREELEVVEGDKEVEGGDKEVEQLE